MGLLITIAMLITALVMAGLNWEKYSRTQRALSGSIIGFLTLILIIFLGAVTMTDSGATQGEKVTGLAYYLKSVFGFDPQHPLLFTEFYFWAFFLLVMIGFSLVHKRRLMRSVFLMAIGLFFYWKTSG